ncbi:hypothetical protein DXG01_000353 [Tephrocybe rancida]|nr:hypothetical protein DXG01_000353 [Tephrocybe rancida]
MAQPTAEYSTCVDLEGSSAPSLEEVPREYFVQSLRALAPHYWNRPETSDCTIIVPIPHLPGGPLQLGLISTQTHPTVSSLYDASGSGRRATEPALNLPPRLRLQLHVDYLSTHSSYIRALLSGANPIDLVHTTTDTYSGPKTDRRYTVPPNRLPRLMPGPANHPTLYLPVPDPSSFHLIVHWMYFGDTTYMDECLRQKLVHWEGIARNAEYLGVSSELRVFLKSWYYGDLFAAEDSDTAYSDSDSDDDRAMDEYESSTASDDESEPRSDNEKDPPRGRPRIRRPLSYQEPGTKPWYH